MKQKGFTLIELLVVVAIIGILAAVGTVAYQGYITAAKVMHAKSNHKTVVNFIMASIGKCQTGEELILKYSYSMATGKLTYSNDKCPDILSGDAVEMQSAFWFHFNSPPWCNPHGLKHTSGTCQEAIANGGSVGSGKLGETQIISSGDLLIIDTKVSDSEIFNKSIKLNW
tara:strand:+ start:54 stop:563 length:510 start_codon:yes stop_codon:yes gene_type:complete